MKQFTLRERGVLPYGRGEKVTATEASAFEGTKGIKLRGVLRVERKAIQFGPFCGVLRAGDVMVELLPKFESEYDMDGDARGLLVGLLRAAGKFRLSISGRALLGQQKTHLLDIFILDFCTEVQDALRREGIFSYTEYAENLPTIRGRLDRTEHLRRNAVDQSKLYCRFDERTVDNLFNRALKAVLHMLLAHSVGASAKSTVATLLRRFDEVGHHPGAAKNIDDLSFDQTNEHWCPVFKQAAWLAKGLFPDLRLGSVQRLSLTFSMEKLFEQALGRCLVRGSRGNRWRIKLQDREKFLAKLDSRPWSDFFQLQPDITIWDGTRIVSILDAKWKWLDGSKSHMGISSADAYQMTAYASRYRCNQLVLIFPATKDFPAGVITGYKLQIPKRPCIHVVAVDLQKLASSSGLPQGLEAFVRPESH